MLSMNLCNIVVGHKGQRTYFVTRRGALSLQEQHARTFPNPDSAQAHADALVRRCARLRAYGLHVRFAYR